MTQSANKILSWFDYLIAHPLTIPLWAALFGWMVDSFSVGWFWLIPVSFLAFWLYEYLNSAPRLFAWYSRNAEAKEVLPCTQFAKT